LQNTVHIFIKLREYWSQIHLTRAALGKKIN